MQVGGRLAARQGRGTRASDRGRRVLCAILACMLCACSAGDTGDAGQERGAADDPASTIDPAVASHEGGAPPRLVILVSIDTLRADHLGSYGYERFTSPMLDLLAAEGTLFEDASSAAPWTLPSHATMLTGLYPLTHQVVALATALDPEVATLPSMLAESGYRTAAVVSSDWLRRERHGVTKDFDDYLYVDTKPWRKSPNTWITDQAIQWIEAAGDQKLFVMLHYFDVHGDYTSEPEYESMFVAPYEGPADGTSWQLLKSSLEPEFIEKCRTDFDKVTCTFGEQKGKVIGEDFERIEFGEADIAHLVDLYDAGIRQMDAEFGRFLAYLRKQGLLDDALLIVTSDHGEGFYEHERLDHFLSTHQEVLRVPLIMRGPRVPAGLRIQAPVSLVDLVPTVLELADMPAPPGLEGLSLVPLFEAADEAPYRERPLHGEAPGGLTYETILPGAFPIIRSIRRDNWKLVHNSKTDAYSLYDLSVDPLEAHDLAQTKPAIAARLEQEMKLRYEGFDPANLPNATVELSEEEIEELRALGYVP